MTPGISEREYLSWVKAISAGLRDGAVLCLDLRWELRAYLAVMQRDRADLVRRMAEARS